ncbi:hypothetical protein VPHK469_0048 [Vibrio phage K469]
MQEINTKGRPLGELSNIGFGQSVGRSIRAEQNRGIVIVDDLHPNNQNTDWELMSAVAARLGMDVWSLQVQMTRAFGGKSTIAAQMLRYEVEVQRKANELVIEAEEIAKRMFYRPTTFTADGFIEAAKERLAEEPPKRDIDNPEYLEALEDAKAWLQEVVDEAPSDDLNMFLTTRPSNLVMYHTTLGRELRNNVLWKHKHTKEGSSFIGGLHVDDISMHAIEAIHQDNQDKITE